MTTIQDLTIEPGFDLHWQMTNCERLALIALLQLLKPKLSIEVGTYLGGSLQVLARFSESVISADIDPGVRTRLAGKFNNVEFRSADPTHLLPDLVREVNTQKRPVDFILIDADHTETGIRRDIEVILELEPQQPMTLVLHDSFNPDCREGMRTAQWTKSPFVHAVELDFIPGVYHYEAYDTAEPKTMWGGFACAVLSPEKRSEPFTVRESQRHLYEAVKRGSSHAPPSNWRRLERRVRRFIGKRIHSFRTHSPVSQ
jgi:Methyltransferase domain